MADCRAYMAELTAEEWDGQLEVTVAMTIRSFMSQHPAPADSACAVDFAEWSESLLYDGQSRLLCMGARSLRLVED